MTHKPLCELFYCFLTCLHILLECLSRRSIEYPIQVTQGPCVFLLHSFHSQLHLNLEKRTIVTDIMAFASRLTLCEFIVLLDPCWARNESRRSLPSFRPHWRDPQQNQAVQHFWMEMLIQKLVSILRSCLHRV